MTALAHSSTSESFFEVFVVLTGSVTIRLGDADVTLGPGQLYVLPRGVEHQPISLGGAEVLLVEPSTTVNAGRYAQ